MEVLTTVLGVLTGDKGISFFGGLFTMGVLWACYKFIFKAGRNYAQVEQLEQNVHELRRQISERDAIITADREKALITQERLDEMEKRYGTLEALAKAGDNTVFLESTDVGSVRGLWD